MEYNHDRLTSLAIAPDGSIYAAGSRGVHAAVIRFSPTLDETASVWLDFEQCRLFTDVALAPDGSVYASGSWFTGSVVVRYSPDLGQQAVAELEGISTDVVTAAPDGTVFVAGFVYLLGNRTGIATRHLSADLDAIASSKLDLNDDDSVQAMLASPDGYVYISGFSRDAEKPHGFLICYDYQLEEIGFFFSEQAVFGQLALAPDGTVYALGRSDDTVFVGHYRR